MWIYVNYVHRIIILLTLLPLDIKDFSRKFLFQCVEPRSQLIEFDFFIVIVIIIIVITIIVIVIIVIIIITTVDDGVIGIDVIIVVVDFIAIFVFIKVIFVYFLDDC